MKRTKPPSEGIVVITVSGPNISPSATTEDETKDTNVLDWEDVNKGGGWKSGDLNIGDTV